MTRDLPLVVDLDGTLLRSDLLLETGVAFVRRHPLRWFAPFGWLARGKAVLKRELADAADLDVSVLPYEGKVLDLVRSARARGRRIVLATASHRSLAVRVAAHLGIFDDVIATDGSNLSAGAKRDALVQAFGEHGFDYAANSPDDLPVWAAAQQAVLVNASGFTERRARNLGNVASVLRSDPPTVRDWLQALRLHQWLKNLLLFVPLFAAHRFTELPLVWDLLLAFFCFGLCASSVYLLNDLLDLGDDRHHPSKRARPLASGRLPIQRALAAFPLLLAAAIALALAALPPAFAGGLAAYFLLTLAYSLWLKRLMVIDVMTLAASYTLRIIVGAVALAIPLSFWLLAFSMFLFLSLALVKRYAELFQARSSGQSDQTRGRGYFPDDLEMIAALGAAAGYLAVMVLALYVNDAQTVLLYRNPQFIWLACPLLLIWITRVWMLAHRGQVNEDPVLFAVHDRPSLVIGALLAIVFWAAS